MIYVKEVQCGRLSPLVATAADNDHVAKGVRRGGRAGARVGRSGGGAVRVIDATTQHLVSVPAHFPLKRMAAEPRLLSFRQVERHAFCGGGPHRSFVKKGFTTRASADRKRCVSDLLRIRRGAINKVHGREDLRRHHSIFDHTIRSIERCNR